MHITRFTTSAVLLVCIGLIPLTVSGCSGSSPRPANKGDALDELNPAIAYSKRQHEEAIKHFTRASKLHLEGKPDEALIEYRKTLELDNQLYAAWNNMGQLLMEQANYADAVSAYKIASGLEPTDPRPEYNIGLTYQKVGWAQDSFNYFQRALERDPNYLPAMRGLVRSAEMLGLADPQIMSMIRNAQLRETDEQWREYLSTQFYRVQAVLDD